MDMVRLLLSRGANKNRLASLSGGPLHVAVSVGGAVDIVRVLVKAGADVHLRNNQVSIYFTLILYSNLATMHGVIADSLAYTLAVLSLLISRLLILTLYQLLSLVYLLLISAIHSLR